MPKNTHKSIPTTFGAIGMLLLLSGGTMFLCLDCFMDTELLPKRYCFLAGIAEEAGAGSRRRALTD